MTSNIWYDKLAPFHEIGTLGDCFYRKPRKVAIERLSPGEGATVFDIFCGTGIDFPLLRDKVGTKGTVYAVDGSPGMIRRARRRARKISGQDRNFRFLRADLGQDSGVRKLCEEIQARRPTHLLFSLGLTCLPNWKSFSAQAIEASPPGSQICIIDIHSSKLTPEARFLNWIGSADCRQPVWQELERRAQAFKFEEFKPVGAFKLSVIVAHGKKPSVPSE